MAKIPLRKAVEKLLALYGKPRAPKPSGPWEWILWENCAYLATDEKRERAFAALKKVGTKPERILAASEEALLEVTKNGIMAARFADKLRACATTLLEDFGGDLRPAVNLPLPRAKSALRKFPGIGAPGAEKILLFTKSYPLFALDSNGLRVLLRLGFGEEKKSYAASYSSAQKAAAYEAGEDYAWLTAAHDLLRAHGQSLCRRTNPGCEECPLAAGCVYRARTVGKN